MSFVAPKTKADQVKHRHEVLKWNGWGYKDTKFFINKDGVAEFVGSRYQINGAKLPLFMEWMAKHLGLRPEDISPSQPELSESDIPPPIKNEAFLRDIRKTSISISDDGNDRVYRGHGHHIVEIYRLREGKCGRVPDLVVWPENHEQAVTVVELATKHNCVIIPYGGGTTVSMSLLCPPEEKRMIISVDTSQMNRILWVDAANFTVCAQGGIVGMDLEKQLADRGFCTGHEPDSNEFSTLGGWVATRASGMKKTNYGNIEDLLVHVKMVTPKGVMEKKCQVPRISSGPDIHHLILGSEGTLGLITEVTIKIRPLPECQRYDALVFPDFESGLRCVRDLAAQRCVPASFRLVDNSQLQLGLALRMGSNTFISECIEKLKLFYINTLRGFDSDKMSAATLLFEGTKEEVTALEKRVYSTASSYGALSIGSEYGKRGYQLTFVIAYLRDIGLNHFLLGETMETSVPWNRCLDLCQNVYQRMKKECRERGIQYFYPSFRVTQTYDAGACVYFYLSYNYKGIPNPLEVNEELTQCARDEIIANGGSLSHHHGVGKVRRKWLRKTVGDVGVGFLQALKQHLDPKNIFGVNNILTDQQIKGEIQEESDDVQLPSKL